jgi:hypothetical protein
MTTFTRELETVGRTRATVTPRLLSICSCLVVGGLVSQECAVM